MRIKKFNESFGTSEKEILDNIRKTFIVLKDDNDVEMSFTRYEIASGLTATITIYINNISKNLLGYKNRHDDIKDISKIVSNLSSVSNILSELGNLLIQFESECDYKWVLSTSDIESYSTISLKINTGEEFSNYDSTIIGWEFPEEDGEEGFDEEDEPEEDEPEEEEDDDEEGEDEPEGEDDYEEWEEPY